jgi:HemY protein
MLWSLVKILIFVGLVTAATYGAVMLGEMSGHAQITLAGLEFRLGPVESLVALVVFIGLVWLLFKFIGLAAAFFRFLNGDETALSRYFTRNRERRGYEALADGMMALASGEGHLALAKAAKAERYLQRPELTTLLTAQAAEMAGDRKKAEETYKKLLVDDRTRFVGIRGIMKQKLIDGDSDTALKLAEKAFAIRPKHEETQDILLRLQSEKGDWAGARNTLGAKLKAGYLPRDVHRRRDAMLALSEAKGVFDENSSIEAREAAIEANRLSPDLIPAAVLAARAYIADGNKKYAARVLTKAWGAQPHPDLAAAFAAIEPDETAKARLERFKAITKLKPKDPETKMLLAELLVATEDFSEARRALGDIAASHPTTRSLSLLAAIEKGAGAEEDEVRALLAKAVNAPRGPQWICDKCNNIHADWAPVCGNCGAFDTLTWKEPVAAETGAPFGAGVMPLPTSAAEAKIIVRPRMIDGDPDAGN